MTEHAHAHAESREEALALLKYMTEHNAHHAEELEELAAELPENAGRLAREAVGLLNASTEKLREALAAAEN